MMELALITKSTGSNYEIKLSTGENVDGKIKGKLRIKDLKSTNPVAVGDIVTIRKEGDNYMIVDFEKRKNYIVRKSVNLSKQTQVIAANIDQLILVCSLSNPQTQTGFIDRYLIAAEAQHIPVIILFNKFDNYIASEKQNFEYLKNIYTQMGYMVLGTSIYNNEDVEKIKEITSNKISLFSGNSGVGKSSLLNTLDSAINTRTGEVSDHNVKGKHTTTFAEMFFTKYNATIIDTPGVKSFGIVNLTREEVAGYFADFRKYATNCKFNNCTHINEPKCAVKDAIEKEELASFRYENYLNIFDSEELADKY